MENVSYFRLSSFEGLKKTFRIMRITIVMLFVAVLQTFAVESYSQTANVNVKAGQMKLTDLFSQIEEQT